MFALLLPSFLAIVTVISATDKVIANLNYKIWCTGNCDKDIKPTGTKPGVVLMGGGTDTDEAFIWQIGNAAKGDFVVIRTSGDDAYNSYIYDLAVAKGAKLNSVTTILFRNAKASQEKEVLDTLQNAEAIFMAGGDQGEYLQYWRGTQVQTILQSKLNSNVTIGGTSAGCMVLGHWTYSAEEGSITSDEALKDPYDSYLTIQKAFLNIPYLESFITDTHFVTRDRMGRLLTFLARINKDIDSKPATISRGVGIDEHTALLLDIQTGAISSVGIGSAYICTADHPAAVCKSKTSLTFQELSCVRLNPLNGDQYSLATFKGDGKVYQNDVVAGKITNLPYGPKN